MKSSASGKNTTSNSKSKKHSKDREKRKSQCTAETNNQQNSEKGSPNKDGSTRKYAGYGTDQLIIMADQSICEHLTEEVCVAFTEDINYKLRQVIYDALEKARLSSRNYITSADIDDTFDCLQIDKIYGASSTPVWIPFGDQNLHYLDDAKINLIEIAEESKTCVQPVEPIVTRKWLPETKEISKNLKNYFTLMCQAVVDKDNGVRLMALRNIRDNNLIGSIIEWFYHFGYFLLSKDITYDSLTLCALDLIEVLESNSIALSIISDKQIILLARLLLQRILRCVIMSEILKPMCRILAILCKRIPVRKMILKKIVVKFPEIREEYTLPVICVVNHLGIDAIYAILLPYLKHIILTLEDNNDPDLTFEVLLSYSILCRTNNIQNSVSEVLYDAFADGIIPIWQNNISLSKDSSTTEINWLYIKTQLIKTRKKISTISKKHKKVHIEEAFPEDEEDIKSEIFDQESKNDREEQYKNVSKSKITFKFHSFAPAVGRLRFLNLAKFQFSQNTQTSVVIGKRTLLTPVLGHFKKNKAISTPCINHSMMFYNL